MPILSKLDAVNIVLSGIGEDPVSSLSSGLPDAEAAERALDAANREIQEKGWHCNTDEEVVLTPTTGNEIKLPEDTLRVDSSGTSKDRDVVQRGNRLYDRDNQTFTFTENITCKVITLLDFEDLPYALANFIAWTAAGKYEMQSLGSTAMSAWIQREIENAATAMNTAEEDADDANVLRDSDSVNLTVYRRNNYALR